MSTIQSVVTGAEADSIPPENQLENPSTQNTMPHSVTVKVENPESVTEQQPITDSQLKQNKQGLFSKSCTLMPRPLWRLMLVLLFVCLSPLIYACVTTATVAILSLTLAAFVVVRSLQFVIKSEKFGKHMIILILMRYWIILVALLLLVEAVLFYPIAKYVPSFKLVVVIGTPITEWIKIICMLVGIYLLSQVIWLFLALIMTEVVQDNNKCALVTEAISEIISCLLIRWAGIVVMSKVSIFEQSKIFGIYTQNWIEVSLFLLIGYNIITLLTHIFVWSLPKLYGDHLGIGKQLETWVCCKDLGKGAFNKRFVVYICFGIMRSIIFILSVVMLLLTWVLYFGDRLNTTSKNKRVLEFGTWTLLSVLVCSFLWLMKSCILLFWEVHTVYDRLHSKIADVGKQLYFLILLSYNHYERVFESSVDGLDNSPNCGSSSSTTPHKKKTLWVLLDSNYEGEEYKIYDRNVVREVLMNRIDPKAKPSLYHIQQAAQYFLSADYILSDESLSTDLRHLQRDSTVEDNEFIVERLNKIIQDEDYSEKDWKMLLDLLPGEHIKEDISFDKVKTWMERAHSRCRFMVNTLISEKEVVKCLNQVISGLIIVVTFIMWLLLTGLATTNVLVLVASPLLAATFIFGDTCKNLFQGLIFVYVVHPFDVGDLCFIDDKLMEVKRIGVWSTIFSQVRTIGKHQEVIYPNSELATKNIINHKTEFDWNDYLEFSLSSPSKEKTQKMKHEIECYINDEKQRFVPSFHSVEFLEIGEKAKIGIHIKHTVENEGWTYFECLKEKERRRFEFAQDIQNLLNQYEPKPETPAVAETSENMEAEMMRDD